MNADTVIKVEIGMKLFWPGDKEAHPVETYRIRWISLDYVEGRYPLNEWIEDKQLMQAFGIEDKYGVHRILFNDRCQKCNTTLDT